MIVLPNYLVPSGQPEVHPFGTILCHPDDRQAILAEIDQWNELVAGLQEGYEQVERSWKEHLQREDESGSA